MLDYPDIGLSLSFALRVQSLDWTACGVVLCVLLLFALHGLQIWHFMRRFATFVYHYTRRGTVTMLTLAFLWLLVSKGEALSPLDHEQLVEHFADNPLVLRNLAYTENLHKRI